MRTSMAAETKFRRADVGQNTTRHDTTPHAGLRYRIVSYRIGGRCHGRCRGSCRTSRRWPGSWGWTAAGVCEVAPATTGSREPTAYCSSCATRNTHRDNDNLEWLGSRVVSVLDSGAEGPGFKSQSRRCQVTVLGKLFTPIVPLFTKQRNL